MRAQSRALTTDERQGLTSPGHRVTVAVPPKRDIAKAAAGVDPPVLDCTGARDASPRAASFRRETDSAMAGLTSVELT